MRGLCAALRRRHAAALLVAAVRGSALPAQRSRPGRGTAWHTLSLARAAAADWAQRPRPHPCALPGVDGGGGRRQNGTRRTRLLGATHWIDLADQARREVRRRAVPAFGRAARLLSRGPAKAGDA